MDDCPEELIPTRKSLLGRLKDWQDDASWQEFFNTYWRLIYGFALQRGLTHQEAEDVVQETVLAVARNISNFQYDPARCGFKTWLLQVTRSKIANQHEKRARAGPRQQANSENDSRTTALLERVPDAAEGQRWERAWDEQWEKNVIDSAVQRVKRRVSIEQFQMFDLFVIKGWPARDVAKTLGVTIAHVYVAKHRVGRLVQKEATALKEKGI